jgi:hypothetical protein
MQAPGVPGAGNILDPEVRAEIRERLHPAVHDAGQLARGQQEEGPAQSEESGEEAPPVQQQEPAPASEPQRHRAGPFPHGDVDLRGFVANVPPQPVRVHRGRTGRRFYFLQEEQREGGERPSGPPRRQGPKPG